MQCYFLTDLNLGHWFICALLKMFKECIYARCTEVTAASWMLKLFGEVGGDVPEHFSSGEDF